MIVPLAVADILAGAVLCRGRALGVPLAVAVADAWGRVLRFSSMDGAMPAAAGLAMDKAHTSAVTRRATHELARAARPGGELAGIENTRDGRIVLLAGGLPLFHRGRLAAGLGVAGGTAAQDLEAARAAEAAWEAMSWLALNLFPGLAEGTGRLMESNEYVGGPDAGTASGAMRMVLGAIGLARTAAAA